jgi:hypothetical protein
MTWLILAIATAIGGDSTGGLDEFELYPQEQELPRVDFFESLGTFEPPYRAFGPLSLPSRSPMQILRMTFTPSAPMTLAAGRLLVRESFTWANVWGVDPWRYRIDMETIRVSTAAFYGVTDRIQVGVEVGALTASGGFADPAIEAFHDLFGISNQDRERYERNQFLVWLRAPQDSLKIDRRPTSPEVEDPVLHLQVRLADGAHGSPVWAAGAQVRVASGPPRVLQQGRGVDAGVFLSFAQSWETVVLYGSIMAARFSTREFHGLELRRWQWSSMLAVECRVGERSSVIVQYLATRGAIEDLGELSRPSHEVSVGYKTELSPGALLEIGILENLFLFDNSPDIGLHVGMTWAG